MSESPERLEEEVVAEAYTLTFLSDRQKEPVCRNCRWWDQHSRSSSVGDCKHDADGIGHIGSRCPMGAMRSLIALATRRRHPAIAAYFGRKGSLMD